MPKKSTITEAPYTTDINDAVKGSLIDFPMQYQIDRGIVEFLPIEPLTADLTLTNLSRGRSAANFELSHDDGRTFTIFLIDLLDLLQHGAINQGRTGERIWTVAKRGKNYGIKVVW